MSRFKRVIAALCCLVIAAASALSIQSNAPQTAALQRSSLAVEGIHIEDIAAAQLPTEGMLSGTAELSRLELASGDSHELALEDDSEILVIEQGAVRVVDSFGFGASYSAGESMVLPPGATYALAPDGDGATMLRLGIAETGRDGVLASHTGAARVAICISLGSP